ncbi:MAG: hypothetical protein JO287_02015 [Pseudonocardiales bacterium]|nr:hypothetical protein [Pseudonocardiales bacterium]
MPLGSAERSAVTSSLCWMWEPAVVEPARPGVGTWVPDVLAVAKLVVAGWAGAAPDAVFGNGLAAVLDPVLCWIPCPPVALLAVVLVAGEELKLPRSACGATPLLAVDECSTVVVSGCEVA